MVAPVGEGRVAAVKEGEFEVPVELQGYHRAVVQPLLRAQEDTRARSKVL